MWAVVSDPSTHTAWRPALVEYRQVSEGPLEVGSRIQERIRWRGREIEIDDVVTALDPPRRLGIRGGWKPADFELDFLLATESGGTLASFDWSFLPKTFFMRVATPFLARTLRGATKDELGPEGVRREQRPLRAIRLRREVLGGREDA